MVFEIDTGGPQEWMPPHYVALSEASIWNAAQKAVTPMCWGMTIAVFPEPHVKHLSSAASKYRLAAVCEGLTGGKLANEEWTSLGAAYFEKYSAQALITLTFVAVESHLRMLGTKWQDFPHHRTELQISDLAELVRGDLGTDALEKLSKAMSEKKLKHRLKRFAEGEDTEVLAVISALRNAFAHGKLGVQKSISLDCARVSRQMLLDMIKSDTELIVRSLNSQDRSMLVV